MIPGQLDLIGTGQLLPMRPVSIVIVVMIMVVTTVVIMVMGMIVGMIVAVIVIMVMRMVMIVVVALGHENTAACGGRNRRIAAVYGDRWLYSSWQHLQRAADVSLSCMRDQSLKANFLETTIPLTTPAITNQQLPT